MAHRGQSVRKPLSYIDAFAYIRIMPINMPQIHRPKRLLPFIQGACQMNDILSLDCVKRVKLARPERSV